MVDYIDCKEIADRIHGETARILNGRTAKLRVVKSADYDKYDALYLKGIERDAERVGIELISDYPDGYIITDASEFCGNLYLGRGWSKWSNLLYDVDGVGLSAKRVMSVVEATMLLVDKYAPAAGKQALVIGRGRVGRQVARELLARDASIAVVHSKNTELAISEYSCFAGIIINTGMKGGSLVTPCAKLVIDITGAENRWVHLHDDDTLYLTPRLNGVGLITRAILLNRAAKALR